MAPGRISKTERKLLNKVGRAIRDFGLIGEGDRVLVAMSGGKDSYSLLKLLHRLQERAPVDFTLVPWHLDQGQPGYDGAPLRRWLDELRLEHQVVRQDTFSVVLDKQRPGTSLCVLCSRLRRGILYNAAEELGCNRIALGHHGDDAVETALMNMLFTGQLKAMPPWLESDDGRNVVIRPLIYAYEREIERYAQEQRFPIIPCGECATQEDLKRNAVKALIDQLEERYPKARESMLASLTHVRPTHLVDADLWRALGLGSAHMPTEGGGQKRWTS